MAMLRVCGEGTDLPRCGFIAHAFPLDQHLPAGAQWRGAARDKALSLGPLLLHEAAGGGAVPPLEVDQLALGHPLRGRLAEPLAVHMAAPQPLDEVFGLQRSYIGGLDGFLSHLTT